MPSQITCPSCGGPLRVPEELFGRRVQCPTCQSIFVAENAGGGPPPVARPEDAATEAPRRPRRPQYDDNDYRDDDYGEARPRRRWLQPHRGTLILVLGILSLVVCGPLGIAAWVMGNTDLAAMRRGEMDPSGEGTTQAGRICGMIASILMIVVCVGYSLIGVLAIGGGAAGNRF
jgi:hypothetical protein